MDGLFVCLSICVCYPLWRLVYCTVVAPDPAVGLHGSQWCDPHALFAHPHPRDSWQPFYWLGHHSRAAVVAHSWRIVNHCKRSMLMDVDKLSSCSRFSDSVVGFTGQKTQPTA